MRIRIQEVKKSKMRNKNTNTLRQLLGWPRIRILIWIQNCMEAAADPGSGSALQPMRIHWFKATRIQDEVPLASYLDQRIDERPHHIRGGRVSQQSSPQL